MNGARSVAAALAATAAALAGCAGSPAHSHTSGGAAHSPAAAGANTAALRWHPCAAAGQGAAASVRLRCAQLRVPLDYQHPAGRTITLALSEVPATAPPGRRAGVLLVNPGGPGANGLSLAAQVASRMQPAVAARYDIVGFDTRGVGASLPALSCDPSFFRRPRPDYADPADEPALVNRAKSYAAACERRFGWLLPHMTTQDNARDLDSIRAALGQRQISYFGYSYGTYLGQVYATMFPHRVKRMVLDSIVDPEGAWYADNISQDYAFQPRMNAFFAWVAQHHSVYQLGATAAQVQAAYTRVSVRLETDPISDAAGPLIGPDELSDTLLLGAYNNEFWPLLAAGLAAYIQHGSGAELMSVYQAAGVQNENEFAVYNAVECSDVAWPRNWATWDAAARRVSLRAPYETWANTWFNASCAFWPVHGPATPMRIDGAGLPPVLLLQGTLDAPTPYHGALVVRRLLPTARLVVVQGGGNHGQSLDAPPNSCVDGYVNRYLANGSLPSKPGLVSATCPALPAPAP